jgi:hypothetical protein
MATEPIEVVPMRCPRCGGEMYKPVNSTFYWHANANHARCSITNIAAANGDNTIQNTSHLAKQSEKKK